MAEKMPPALGVGALPFRWEINSGRDKVRNGSVETGESGCKTMFVFSRQVLILLDFINTVSAKKAATAETIGVSSCQYT